MHLHRNIRSTNACWVHPPYQLKLGMVVEALITILKITSQLSFSTTQGRRVGPVLVMRRLDFLVDQNS